MNARSIFVVIGYWLTPRGNSAAAPSFGRRDVPADVEPAHRFTDTRQDREYQDREREYAVLLSSWM